MRAGVPTQEGYSLEIAVNSHGIVLPPRPIPCRGEECKYESTDEGCQIERHHLHIGEQVHADHSLLAEDFRDLRSLTVWMPECVHDELHDENPFSIGPPNDDVMEQAIHEDMILKEIGMNFAYIRDVRAQLALSNQGLVTRRKLDYAHKKFLTWHETLIEGVGGIEVIPAQLVTGFLLIAAPKLARRRVIEKTGYALTASSKDFRPEIYDPVDDFMLGGILHDGQEIRLRPNIIPHKTQNLSVQSNANRHLELSVASAAA